MSTSKRHASVVRFLCFLGFVLTVTSAIAQDTGWYIGAGLGRSSAKIDDGSINAGLLGLGFTSASTTKKENDTAYKLFVGYRVNQYFSLEGGYFSLGKFTFTSTVTPPGSLNGEIKVDGLNLDAVGIWPLTKEFSLLGRAGVQNANTKDTFTGSGSVMVINPNPSKRATNYKLGLGAEYDFAKEIGVRGEWERYRVDDALGSKADVDVLSLGLIYRF